MDLARPHSRLLLPDLLPMRARGLRFLPLLSGACTPFLHMRLVLDLPFVFCTADGRRRLCCSGFFGFCLCERCCWCGRGLRDYTRNL